MAEQKKHDATTAKEDSPRREPAKAEAPVRMVTLSNKLAQAIQVSVDRGNGPEVVALPPHGSSVPVAESHLTPYTLGFVEKGHVKLRAAK